jgi:hypothetical protein
MPMSALILPRAKSLLRRLRLFDQDLKSAATIPALAAVAKNTKPAAVP